MPRHHPDEGSITYAFIEAGLVIKKLQLAVGLRVLLLQGLDANSASINGLLEVHAARLALDTDRCGDFALFHLLFCRLGSLCKID